MARRFLAAPGIGLLLLAGCASPEPNYYHLETLPPTAGIASVQQPQAVQIGRITIPAELDRPQLVSAGSGGKLDLAQYDRWAASLDSLVRQALAQDLIQRLPSVTIAADDFVRAPSSTVVTLAIDDFIADASGQVVLQVRWAVIPPGGTLGPLHPERIAVPIAGTGAAAIVDAMSHALAELSDRIARNLI